MTANVLNDLDIINSLKEEDECLYNFVLEYIDNAKEKLKDISDVFEEYTDHSWKHSKKILYLGDELLSDNSLSKWEKVVFILSACYHDIGMCCSKKELEEIRNSKEFQDGFSYLRENILSMNQIDDSDEDVINRFIQIEFIRRKHGRRSYNWIMNEFSMDKEKSYYDNVYIWEAVALVSEGHTLNIKKLQKEPYTTEYSLGSGISIDIVFITCLLRLSDICHLSRDRALPYIRKSIDFYSKKSLDIWKSYAFISDTRPSRKSNCIKISATCSDYKLHRAIVESANAIEDELRNEHHLLYIMNSNYSFPWKFVGTSGIIESRDADYFYSDDRFKLNFGKITELLIGSKLYRDKLFSIRECIQNSIDAISIYKLKNPFNKFNIILRYDSKKNIMDILDNGTGMDKEICSKNLLSIGSDSFWVSERRYKEWGNSNLSLIASHGIGFMSTFMIANQIEVFSKYPDKFPIHMIIDSFKTSVVYKKTPLNDFPGISEIWKMPTPWQEGHGTCIRLHLKDKLTKLDLMEFISENIIRIPYELNIIFDNEKVITSDIWHTERNYSKVTNEEDLEKIHNNLFNKPARDFYSNPPMDKALNREVFDYGFIKGKVFLSGTYRMRNRISQNGIVIQDGHRYILDSPLLKSNNKEIIDKPFYFDIDVSEDFSFELDAERARIIDNNKNKQIRQKVSEILIKEYFKSISLIQSTLYFPCGGRYYHGADSIYINNSDLIIEFHEQLKKFLTVEKIEQLNDICSLETLFTANIYITFQGRNKPINIFDVIDKIEDYYLYIPKVFELEKKYDAETTAFQEWIVEKQSDELVELDKSMALICIPDFTNGFVLPLLYAFKYSVIKETPYSYLLKLEKKEQYSVTNNEMNEFNTLCKFNTIPEELSLLYNERV